VLMEYRQTQTVVAPYSDSEGEPNEGCWGAGIVVPSGRPSLSHREVSEVRVSC
jgi:hypothetical protein